MTPEESQAAGAMLPVVHEVLRVDRETDDTVTLSLAARDTPLAAPDPGQFNMLWAPGVGEVPISLAGQVGDHLVHTVRAVGAVTSALCALQRGDQLGVRGPFGRGWGLEDAEGRDILIVAGGLGLAPLRPVIDAVRADRSRYGRVAVIIGSRAPDALLYTEELADWAADLDARITVDVAPPGWRGDVGAVTALLGAVTTRPDRELAFVCGPEIMMRVVANAITERGTAAEDVRVSLERNMHCGIGQCGRCQLGPLLLCQDGPVASWDEANPLLAVSGR